MIRFAAGSDLLGRALLALLFLLSAVKKILAPAAATGQIAATGAPLPDLAFYIVVLAELGGSIALLLGWKTRAAAAVLAIFTVAATMLVHWHPGDPSQMIHVYKNLAIIGGLLHLTALGPSAWSFDHRRQQTVGQGRGQRRMPY